MALRVCTVVGRAVACADGVSGGGRKLRHGLPKGRVFCHFWASDPENHSFTTIAYTSLDQKGHSEQTASLSLVFILNSHAPRHMDMLIISPSPPKCPILQTFQALCIAVRERQTQHFDTLQ